MPRIMFRNCRVWDGSGAAAYPADVLVDGERISSVATDRGQLDAAGAEVVEANGMTLTPATPASCWIMVSPVPTARRVPSCASTW
jgi:adenine deaminase